MRKNTLVSIFIVVILIVFIFMKNSTNITEVVDLNSNDYTSIKIKNGNTGEEKMTEERSIIDDFIAKLSNYSLKKWDEKEDYSGWLYSVELKSKSGNEIKLVDNNYIVINGEKYLVNKPTINLEKFYNFID